MHDTLTAAHLTMFTRETACGRVIGRLTGGEDGEAIARVLEHATTLVRQGELELMCHEDLDESAGPTARDRARERLRQAILGGRRKHFAVRLATRAGSRIVKLAGAESFGGKLSGMFGVSRGRREHRIHARAHDAGIAAAETLGFLELRRGPWLRCSCQVQSEVPREHLPLGAFMARELARQGPAAAEALGRALAATHRIPFFHSDLKPFHAFVSDCEEHRGAASAFRLRWIDFDRAAFWMSPRKRVINLYQALRYALPDELETQRRFVAAYCESSGWYANAPDLAIDRVRRFLLRKLRTHPQP